MTLAASRLTHLLAAAWHALWRFGLALPMILGVVLLAGVGIALLSAPYEPPTLANAGLVNDYEVADPAYFEAERVWVVRLPENDEFVALSDIDPASNCAVGWRPRYRHLGLEGWFVDACRGSVYDLAGGCFGGPCEQGLSHFRVFRQASEVIVDLTDLRAGPARDDNADPITPEQTQ